MAGVTVVRCVVFRREIRMCRCRSSASVPYVSINGLVIRRAVDSDASAAADTWLRLFTAALPTVRRPRTDREVRVYFRDVVVPKRETWVAIMGGSVAGGSRTHSRGDRSRPSHPPRSTTATWSGHPQASPE
jgi:hypothetical protein